MRIPAAHQDRSHLDKQDRKQAPYVAAAGHRGHRKRGFWGVRLTDLNESDPPVVVRSRDGWRSFMVRVSLRVRSLCCPRLCSATGSSVTRASCRPAPWTRLGSSSSESLSRITPCGRADGLRPAARPGTEATARTKRGGVSRTGRGRWILRGRRSRRRCRGGGLPCAGRRGCDWGRRGRARRRRSRGLRRRLRSCGSSR